MKKILAVFILSFLLILPVSAQETVGTNNEVVQIELSPPGLLPNNPFYFLDQWGEKLSLFFTFNAERHVEKLAKFADEKLSEVNALTELQTQKVIQNRDRFLNKALELQNKYQERISEEMSGVKDIEKEKLDDIRERMAERFLRHQEVLVNVLDRVSENAKNSIEKVIENSKERYDNRLQKLDEVKKQTIKEKNKIRLQTLEDKFNLRREEVRNKIDTNATSTTEKEREILQKRLKIYNEREKQAIERKREIEKQTVEDDGE